MSEISYRPLIEDMVWSYSRLSTFEDCPYRWYLRYIAKIPESPKFYAMYGTLMHELIEQYYRGELDKKDLLVAFSVRFSSMQCGGLPVSSTIQKYTQDAISYLSEFRPFPYEMVAVEKKVKFQIDGKPFIGFIDFLGKQGEDFIIVDNKSRALKLRSARQKPTLKDQELDEMLRQLYLYAAAVEQEYGKFPTKLCFNCFRTGTFIEEPFVKSKYDEAVAWAAQNIENLKEITDFYPQPDFFSCRYICGVAHECCYCDQ